MPPKVDKPIKKDRLDTAVKKEEVTCFPLVVSANNVETVVLLLESEENEILLQSSRALSKFAAISLENIKMLYDLNVLQTVWKYVNHSDVGVRRYSLKLMAQLYDIQEGVEMLIKDDGRINQLLQILIENPTDKFLQEFVSLIFSKLTMSLEGCDKVIHTDILKCAYNNLTSPDPDVRNNYMKILSNILNNPEGANLIAQSVSWQPVLSSMEDIYVNIQNLAIDVINKLVSRQGDLKLLELFKISNGLGALLNILEKYSLKHLHSEVLEVLKNYNGSDMTIVNFYESGCLTRFIQYLEMAPSELKTKCLSVFLKIAMNRKGREMLHMCNVEEVICDILADTNTTLWSPACQAAILMCRHCRSAGIMVDKNIIENLLQIIQNDTVAWEHTKEEAVLLLAEIFGLELKGCIIFMDLKGDLIFRNFLLPDFKVNITDRGVSNILQCFKNMTLYQITRQSLSKRDFLEDLFHILQIEDAQIMKHICDILYNLMVDYEGKELFMECDGIQVIRTILESDVEGIKESACKLIIAIADESTTPIMIREKILNILFQNIKMCSMCPSWQTAIKSLLNSHLPAKFAYLNVLNFMDITKQDFYVMKDPGKRFLDLHEILENRSLDKEPVYICHFSDKFESALVENNSFVSIKSQEPLSKGSENVSALSSSLFDPVLFTYLKKIRNKFVEAVVFKNGDATLVERIQIVAEFVCDQMCGPDPSLICNNHLMELHLTEIKVILGSNLIPIGLIRVGSNLERSVLFKVLADKLDIPAKLCRGTENHAWIEVPVPPPSNLSSEQELINWNLLQPRHVVNLQDKPGRLMPIKSSEAMVYCGKSLDRNEPVLYERVQLKSQAEGLHLLEA